MNTVGVAAGGGFVGEGMGVEVSTGVLVGGGVGVGGMIGTAVGGDAVGGSGVDVSAGLGAGVSDGLDGNATVMAANARVGVGAKTALKAYMPRPPMHVNDRRTPTITPIKDNPRPFDFSICSFGAITGAGAGWTGFGAG